MPTAPMGKFPSQLQEACGPGMGVLGSAQGAVPSELG